MQTVRELRIMPAFRWRLDNVTELRWQLKSGLNPNVVKENGKTPLHMAIELGLVSAATTLLAYRADPDLVGNSFSFRNVKPLSIAASNCSVDMFTVLANWGADLNARYHPGNTSIRHIIACNDTGPLVPREEIIYLLNSLDVPRCDANVFGCKPGCKNDSNFNGRKPEWLTDEDVEEDYGVPAELIEDLKKLAVDTMVEWGSIIDDLKRPLEGNRILSLDGGGVRGLNLIVQLEVLQDYLLEICKEAKEKNPKFPHGKGIQIIQLIDVIGGTSTGAIVAALLSTGYSLRDIQRMYFRLKDKIFYGEPPYESEYLEGELKLYFPDHMKVKDVTKKRLIIFAARCDRPPGFRRVPFLSFPSARELHNLPDEHSEIQLWRALKYSASAPTFILLDQSIYLDGAVAANNPTRFILLELERVRAASVNTKHTLRLNFSKSVAGTVVSLGTGVFPGPPFSAEIFNFPQPTTFRRKIRCFWNFSNVREATERLVDQVTQANGQVVEDDMLDCSREGSSYYRFSPTLQEDVELDDTSDLRLNRMMVQTKIDMLRKKRRICECVVDLLRGNVCPL